MKISVRRIGAAGGFARAGGRGRAGNRCRHGIAPRRPNGRRTDARRRRAGAHAPADAHCLLRAGTADRWPMDLLEDGREDYASPSVRILNVS
ncbi:unnamed protein product, partial [Iphiclides podalirius]